jgi:hypothetical protein
MDHYLDPSQHGLKTAFRHPQEESSENDYGLLGANSRFPMDVVSIEVTSKHMDRFGHKSFNSQSIAPNGAAHRYSISRCSSNEDYCGL